MHALPDRPVMRGWWMHMRDITQTKPDGEPIATALTPMFLMP